MTYLTNWLNILQELPLVLLFTNILFSHVNTNEVELRRLLFHQRPYDRKVYPELGIAN